MHYDPSSKTCKCVKCGSYILCVSMDLISEKYVRQGKPILCGQCEEDVAPKPCDCGATKIGSPYHSHWCISVDNKKASEIDESYFL